MKSGRRGSWARAARAVSLVALLCVAGCVRQPDVPPPDDLPDAADLTDTPEAAQPRPRRGRQPLGSIERGAVYAGIPDVLAAASDFDILANEGYTVGYSEERRNPLWAAYQVFPVGAPALRPLPRAFEPDRRTEARVDDDCYAHSGFARGRQAPSHAIGLCYGASAQRATLLMSNVSPRLPKLERETWRALERLEVGEFADKFGRVWVVTGPIFARPGGTLPCGVQIPNAFYKILVAEDDGFPIVLPLIMTQEDHGRERLRNFTTTVDQIELLTGLDFFPQLPVEVEREVESSLEFDPRWDVDRMVKPLYALP